MSDKYWKWTIAALLAANVGIMSVATFRDEPVVVRPGERDTILVEVTVAPPDSALYVFLDHQMEAMDLLSARLSVETTNPYRDLLEKWK